MSSEEIQSALEKINGESDPTLKHLMLASLCTVVFCEQGIQLVVVGGSAIEFYTEGAYTSGDLDLCVLSAKLPLTVRLRQEVMGKLRAVGGPRSWQTCGAFVDVLGSFENLARTPIRSIKAPFGNVQIGPVEELIVERELISRYPQEYPPARACAIKLISAALQQEVETDWNEVRRLAACPAYANESEVIFLINEQAKALQIRSPYDPNE